MKIVLLVVALMFTPTIQSLNNEMVCVRWTWTGDVYERKVQCLEWRKKENKK